ncbi:hypothetical protein [Streptomyces malaysiensis]|uniref:hypothetical protein n=1 Tax=Streptomyces malaysiensis TaxID=92644 RepID=UPI002B2EE2B1|nr:hypothetical protein R8789_08975 [Streptomyces malaysiensis]
MSAAIEPSVRAIAVCGLDRQEDLYADVDGLPPQESDPDDCLLSAGSGPHAAMAPEIGEWALDRARPRSVVPVPMDLSELGLGGDDVPQGSHDLQDLVETAGRGVVLDRGQCLPSAERHPKRGGRTRGAGTSPGADY